MTVLIKLSKNQVTVVDDEDADLAAFRWCAQKHRDKPLYPYYAVRNVTLAPGKSATVLLHRVVLGRVLGRPLERREFVDHVSGDGLCNTRSNLRLANTTENARNKCLRTNNTSGFKGAYFYNNRWHAAIGIDKKNKYLGGFDSALEAAKAYDEAALIYFRSFAMLNFPDAQEDE